jgi:hypothetical protein
LGNILVIGAAATRYETARDENSGAAIAFPVDIWRCQKARRSFVERPREENATPRANVTKIDDLLNGE